MSLARQVLATLASYVVLYAALVLLLVGCLVALAIDLGTLACRACRAWRRRRASRRRR